MDIWRPLAEGQPVQRYEPGRLIYLQDTEAHQFYYIVSGTAKCFISSDGGEERTLTLHHGGDLIGEAAFFDARPRISSAIALTECTLVRIDRERLSTVFATHPNLAIFMLEYLAKTIRLLSTHLDGGFLPADRRIARHLLSLPAEKEKIFCTHAEIGSCVGVSRVMVSRVLSDFDRLSWLRTAYRAIFLLNRTALDEYANGILKK